MQNTISAQTAPAPSPEINSENLSVKSPVSEENLIHAGDLIDVDVIGSTEFDWRGTLSPEGFLGNPNYSGNPIYGLCQTEERVAQKIAESYSKILRDPKVVVKILDRSNRPVSILYGAVKKNQRFQIKRPVWLNELIIVSGGFTDRASGEIQILRLPNLNCFREAAKLSEPTGEPVKKDFVSVSQSTGTAEYINVKISDLLAGKKQANLQILSGDIITVLEAKPVYVIGGVQNPKQIPVRSQITLSRAIDSAGGLIKGADARKITVFRRVGLETKTIEADLDKIKAGQIEDVILLPFDIVEVTETGRGKRRFPPVFKDFDKTEKRVENLPLQIID
ncbi:MAG: SLBB domain-containing protein [Acidobacteriota bacterium]|nr:SLBB domain-containing protein [Acidobacteriota bacterium]